MQTLGWPFFSGYLVLIFFPYFSLLFLSKLRGFFLSYLIQTSGFLLLISFQVERFFTHSPHSNSGFSLVVFFSRLRSFLSCVFIFRISMPLVFFLSLLLGLEVFFTQIARLSNTLRLVEFAFKRENNCNGMPCLTPHLLLGYTESSVI